MIVGVITVVVIVYGRLAQALRKWIIDRSIINIYVVDINVYVGSAGSGERGCGRAGR